MQTYIHRAKIQPNLAVIAERIDELNPDQRFVELWIAILLDVARKFLNEANNDFWCLSHNWTFVEFLTDKSPTDILVSGE